MGNSGLSAACLWLVAMEFPVPHVNSASELATSATTASVDIADCLAAPPVHVCDTDNALFIVVPKQSRSGSTSKPVGQCLADQLRNLFKVSGTNDPSASQHTFYSALPAVQMLIRTHEKQCISPEAGDGAGPQLGGGGSAALADSSLSKPSQRGLVGLCQVGNIFPTSSGPCSQAREN